VVRAALVNNGPHPVAYAATFEINDAKHERLQHPPNFKGAKILKN
jgi:hypothetical protein